MRPIPDAPENEKRSEEEVLLQVGLLSAIRTLTDGSRKKRSVTLIEWWFNSNLQQAISSVYVYRVRHQRMIKMIFTTSSENSLRSSVREWLWSWFFHRTWVDQNCCPCLWAKTWRREAAKSHEVKKPLSFEKNTIPFFYDASMRENKANSLQI